MLRANGTSSAKVIQVIETTALRGEGTEEDKCREVKQYWDFEGKLLAECDFCQQEKAKYDMHYPKSGAIDRVTKGFLHAFDVEERELENIEPNQTEDFRVRVDFDEGTMTFIAPQSFKTAKQIVIGPHKAGLLEKDIQRAIANWKARGKC